MQRYACPASSRRGRQPQEHRYHVRTHGAVEPAAEGGAAEAAPEREKSERAESPTVYESQNPLDTRGNSSTRARDVTRTPEYTCHVGLNPMCGLSAQHSLGMHATTCAMRRCLPHRAHRSITSRGARAAAAGHRGGVSAARRVAVSATRVLPPPGGGRRPDWASPPDGPPARASVRTVRST